MKRLALLLTLVALLAVHTGCRASRSCCCYHASCAPEVQSAAPSETKEGPALESSRHPSPTRGTRQYVGDIDRFDPALPPIPEVDQEA